MRNMAIRSSMFSNMAIRSSMFTLAHILLGNAGHLEDVKPGGHNDLRRFHGPCTLLVLQQYVVDCATDLRVPLVIMTCAVGVR